MCGSADRLTVAQSQCRLEVQRAARLGPWACLATLTDDCSDSCLQCPLTFSMEDENAIGWLQTHLSQPWSASAGAQHVTPELLQALPALLPTLDPLYQQVSIACAAPRAHAVRRCALGSGLPCSVRCWLPDLATPRDAGFLISRRPLLMMYALDCT